MNTQLSLRIHSIKCLDETGGKWVEKLGNDEIYLAGFGIDANGQTTKVPAFEVYADFDDGNVKKYNPPKRFVTLNLGGSTSFPKTCSVGFLLFEKDEGGMGNAVEKIYAKLQEELKKRLGGSSVVPIPWDVILKEVIALIAGYAMKQIAQGIKDDLFPPQDVSVSIPSNDYTWNGSKVSAPGTVEFRGHSGVYSLTYDWELS